MRLDLLTFKDLKVRAKPKKGFSYSLHTVVLTALPVVVLFLSRADFLFLALLVVALSKWRIFATRPRFWLRLIRVNAVDLLFGFSMVQFINDTGTLAWQLVWMVIYGAWLLALKPRSDPISVSLQAFFGQLAALSALYVVWPGGPLFALTIISAGICYFAAHHFFSVFKEPYIMLLSYIWAYFAAALTWLTCHWLLFYGNLAQPALLLAVIGYGLAGLYYFDHFERLTLSLKRQFILVMIVIVAIVLIFSNWGGKIV